MNHLNYDVINKNSNIRWQNWRSFVKNISWTKKNKIAILSIHFNNFLNTKKLLDYLQTERDQNFDIVLIENSTKEIEETQLIQYLLHFPQVIKIKTVSNLWSAGGYALWMEYILANDYDYIFLVEDDVIFLEKNVFSDMIQKSTNNTLTFIHNCKNTRDSLHTNNMWKSWWVQTAWYPTAFIKKVWIIDPRYFFRWEDLEWAIRIENWIKKFGYKTYIVDHNYLHPYLKSVNWNNARFYFSIRNQLLSLKKHPIKYSLFFVTLFLYLFTGFVHCIVKKDLWILKSFFKAIWGFFCNKFSFENNSYKIKAFISDKQQKDTVEYVNFEVLKKITQKVYGNAEVLALSWVDMRKLCFSTRFFHLFIHWILVSSSSTIFYPLTILAPKVICVQEFDLDGINVIIQTYTNKNLWLRLLWVIVSFVFSLLIFPLLFVFIVFYLLLSVII